MAQVTIRGSFDLTVIGGGIVGLATARQVLLKHPKLKVCVLEKENELATHQSKRNSGVVHCGIYYKKGSLKSRFCIKGAAMIRHYCNEKQLPYVECGKMIVAVEKSELDRLHKLFENSQANNIQDIKMISKDRVQKIQPGCDHVLEAIWSPNTAIVDWQQVALSYANDFEQNGGTIIKDFTAYSFIEHSENTTLVGDAKRDGEFVQSKSIVNCAGLYSDYFARQTANNEHPKVVPFKGNYYLLSEKVAKTIRTNIYPVPKPDLPFLGVHITPRIDGSVLVGPTSLLTLSYEKYNREDPLKLLEMYHIVFRSGLRKLIKKPANIEAGIDELWRFFSKDRVAKDARKFLKSIETSDLIDTKFNGIRAQVVGTDGELVDDFLFETGVKPEFNRVLHVRNCPSPAATSSLAIAERIVEILEERLI